MKKGLFLCTPPKFVTNILLSGIVMVLMFIPVWIFMALWGLLDPTDFWQRFAVIAGGVLILGPIQIPFFVAGMALLVTTWE